MNSNINVPRVCSSLVPSSDWYPDDTLWTELLLLFSLITGLGETDKLFCPLVRIVVSCLMEINITPGFTSGTPVTWLVTWPQLRFWNGLCWYCLLLLLLRRPLTYGPGDSKLRPLLLKWPLLTLEGAEGEGMASFSSSQSSSSISVLFVYEKCRFLWRQRVPQNTEDP